MDFKNAEEILFFNEDKFYKEFYNKVKYLKGQVTAENSGFNEEVYINKYYDKLNSEYERALHSIKYYGLQCPYCGKFLGIINNNHLKKHNISVEEYMKNYIGRTATEIIAHKMHELYNPYSFKWTEQNPDGSYLTLNYGNGESEASYTCNLNMLKNHLNHNKTIGIFPVETQNTYLGKFITFDIDTGSEEDVKRLFRVLKNYIYIKNIHLSSSGKKGFHITLYFQNMLTTKQIHALGQKILKLAKLATDKIEIFPSEKRCIKLPLGIHKVTDNLCLFLDRKFNIIEDQFSYFLNIEQIDGLKLIEDVFGTADIDFKEEMENKREQKENKQQNNSVDLNIKQDSRNIRFILQ